MKPDERHQLQSRAAQANYARWHSRFGSSRKPDDQANVQAWASIAHWASERCWRLHPAHQSWLRVPPTIGWEKAVEAAYRAITPGSFAHRTAHDDHPDQASRIKAELYFVGLADLAWQLAHDRARWEAAGLAHIPHQQEQAA